MNQSPLTFIKENIYKLTIEDRVIGYYLYDIHGEDVARIEGALVESGTYLVRYLAITIGGFLFIEGKKLIVPVEICEIEDMGKLKTGWSRESLKDAPNPNDVENVTKDEEELILSYFDMEPYWAAAPSPKKSPWKKDSRKSSLDNPS